MDDQKFRTWKQHLVPYLYDWITNHNLTWPSQTCRWGPKIEETPHKIKYRLYMSEQTDGSEPQKITVCTADVFKPRAAGPEAVSNWSEFSKSPFVKEQKAIFHPGEVNKIRELPQHPNIIVTHTDAPQLFVWNVDKQPARQKKEEKDKRSRGQESVADLKLMGHKDNAQFPLATCSTQPMVASGGTDHLVLTWNLQDSMETVLAGAPAGTKHAPTLQANQTLLGHSDTVEDVVFKPGCAEQLASVGDDHLFLLWDTRQGTTPVTQVEAAHDSHDIHCVDWSALQDELIATGAADGSLKIWDLRKLGGTKDFLYNFEFHQDATMRVEWHPSSRGILASGGDDRIIAVWNLNSEDGNAGSQNSDVPAQLMFQHLGHKNGKVVDFQWNSNDTWLMMSVSDDTDGGAGGGTLQLWRMNDMIYRPEDEVLQELEADREFILTGKPARKPSTPATTNGSAPVPSPEEPLEALVAQPMVDDFAPGTQATPAAASKEQEEEAALPEPVATDTGTANATPMDTGVTSVAPVDTDMTSVAPTDTGVASAAPVDTGVTSVTPPDASEGVKEADPPNPKMEPTPTTSAPEAAGVHDMAVDDAAAPVAAPLAAPVAAAPPPPAEAHHVEEAKPETTAATDAVEGGAQGDTPQPDAAAAGGVQDEVVAMEADGGDTGKAPGDAPAVDGADVNGDGKQDGKAGGQEEDAAAVVAPMET